ncbi:hypothetical protein B0A48_12207 [Cryoendolithus antarcticus]|uniref:Uncharacterized protein n=1 Tax=Cryoendolithus antarcticus TaxID=1507870 RepID=A0A1V8SUK1_9PEZI|nr:hypothetical protein B0A48_12207 [Cryoendolithus antarcticus]
MQRLPTGMLQEVLWQREGKAQQGSEGAGASPERGPRQGTSSTASEASGSLGTPYFTPSSTPQPPFFGEAIEGSPARGRGVRPAFPLSRAQETKDNILRAAAGPREGGEAWRTSTTAQISPQLVGASVGSHSVLTNSSDQTVHQSVLPALSTAPLQDATPLSATNQDTQPRRPDSAVDTGDVSEIHFEKFKFKDSPPKTPSSDESGLDNSVHSSSTSIAHQYRHARSDMALFNKHSKPLAHRKKKELVYTESVQPLRSPTYGKPKVIEDSRDQMEAEDQINSLQASLESTTKRPIGPLKLPQTKQLRQAKSSDSGDRGSPSRDQSRSSSPKTAPKPAAAPKRPGILRSSSSLDVTKAPISFKHVQTGSHSLLGSRRRAQHDSSEHTTPASVPTPKSPFHLSLPKRESPRSTEPRQHQPEDHYFSSLRLSMSSRAGFTPTLAPRSPDQPTPLSPRDTPAISVIHEIQQTANTSPGPVEPTQRRTSIFAIFGKGAVPKASASLQQEGTLSPDEAAEKAASLLGPMSPPISPLTDTRDPMEASMQVRGRRRTSRLDDQQATTLFVPLTPLREDFDRTRRVSIEAPVHEGKFRPDDTPRPSPGEAPAEASQLVSRSVAGLRAESPEAASKGLVKKLNPHARHQIIGASAPTSALRTEVKARRSSVIEEFVAELRGVPSMRKLTFIDDGSSRLLKKRRSGFSGNSQPSRPSLRASLSFKRSATAMAQPTRSFDPQS